MKFKLEKILLTILALNITISCNCQNNKDDTYTQRLEFGLKGEVKELTNFIVNVESDKIPTDTSNFISKSIMTFDKIGNAIELKKIFNIDSFGDSKNYRMLFSGKGKNVVIKAVTSFNNKETFEKNFKYVWSDNYNYTIHCIDNNTNGDSITLDKNHRIIKTIFYTEDSIKTTEESQTIYKNNRIERIISKITEENDNEIIVNYNIQVVKEYDEYENPIVIYVYDDISVQKIEFVSFKIYRYY